MVHATNNYTCPYVHATTSCLPHFLLKTTMLYICALTVTNFIQLVSPQPVDRFSQTKLRWKAPNEGYPHICGMYKSDNKRLRYQDISSCKSFVC